MANFVALLRGEPDPDLDALEYVYYATGGVARIGLWGYYDIWAKRDCTVKVVSGPGSVKVGGKQGSKTMIFDCTGLSEASVLQAFSGDAPFTAEIKCKHGAASSIADDNEARMKSGDPKETPNNLPVKLVPLKSGFGNYKHFPYMVSVNGLAVHITAGGGAADSQQNNFQARGVSTHFVIDREGNIAQYVAASYQSQAQGPGNPNFLSVEMVGSQDLKNIQFTQAMTGRQIDTLSWLYYWVYSTFPGPKWQLATMFTGKKAGGILGFGIDGLYKSIAEDFATRYKTSGTADTINACINSTGLSCHWWLDTYLKSCPGIPMFTQLPKILGFEPYKLASLEKYQLA
jgi:hypothetical protein